MADYQVVEIFESINGEGMRAGELAVFVRMRGCNLNCTYCDTTWANEKETPCLEMTEEEILQKVMDTGIKNVTLTGGEPLLQKEIEILLSRFSREPDLHVEVETNGSVPLKAFRSLSNPPAFTIDYKLSGSGMENRMCMENFVNPAERDTIKFVVSGKEDLLRTEKVIRKYDLTQKCHVIISPVYGKIEPVEIVDFMKAHLLNDVRLQLQLHKFIWDPMKRGV